MVALSACYGPVLSNEIIKSELKTESFLLPFDIPLNTMMGPSYLSQFFGHQVEKAVPKLNVNKFIEQYRHIDVYGAGTCADGAGNPSFIACYI